MAREHYEMRYQNDYIGKLGVNAEECREIVFYRGDKIHDETFPTNRLGNASRGGYLESMTASVAFAHLHGRNT